MLRVSGTAVGGWRVVFVDVSELIGEPKAVRHPLPLSVAAELGKRKAAQIVATGAEAYASANPGCLVQVTSALRGAGRPLPAFHPIELLDASIRGVPKDQLLAEARR